MTKEYSSTITLTLSGGNNLIAKSEEQYLKLLKENFFQVELKNNEYIIFPSILKYFFTRNTSNKTNTYLTIAYKTL